MSTIIVIGTALLVDPAPAQAGLDSEKSATDRSGHRLTVQQWDNEFRPVAPMDRNRLTREWFYSGRVAFDVSGGSSDAFSGTLDFGYQVGIPWSVSTGVNFTYTTPNVLAWDVPPWELTRAPVTPNLFPGASISADIGSGPGVQEVVTLSVPVFGANGIVATANAHGTVSGVAGGVQVRAFSRLTWPDHASITTYGALWNVD
ncbi:porin [Mycolicibacterium mucogenicum]|uniref:Porin n=1 Tax=Mycolicibacterium mucogenicum TaxID=56689 RepID=A0A1A3HAX4_MYCMU|nr:porin [Mycolicibacterium mucogenicum]